MTKIIITESQLKRTLDELFSQKLVNTLADRFKQENPDLDDKIINFYIDRFQQIKDSPKIINKDITTYSWEDLVNTVDPNQPEDIDIKFDNSGLIYNENNLKIYLANSKKACVKYGTGYNFCISARGEGNSYKGYRVGGGGTIYFVEDLDRSKETSPFIDDGSFNKNHVFDDPNHLLVVIAYNDQQHPYEVTDANNQVAGSIAIKSWIDMISLNPKLKNLEYLFKTIDVNPKEAIVYKLENEYKRYLREFNEEFSKNYSPNELFRILNNGKGMKEITDLFGDIDFVTDVLDKKPIYIYKGYTEAGKFYINQTLSRYIDPKIWVKNMNKWFKEQPPIYDAKIEIGKPTEEYLDYLKRIREIYRNFLHEKNQLNIQN